MLVYNIGKFLEKFGFFKVGFLMIVNQLYRLEQYPIKRYQEICLHPIPSACENESLAINNNPKYIIFVFLEQGPSMFIVFLWGEQRGARFLSAIARLLRLGGLFERDGEPCRAWKISNTFFSFQIFFDTELSCKITSVKNKIIYSNPNPG